MSQPEQKIVILRRLIAAGDKEKALALAARFPRLGDARDAVLRGHQAVTNPRWAIGLRRDPAADIAAGWDALIRAYAPKG